MSHARSSQEAEASPPDRDLAAALHEVSNALTVVLGWLEEARAASRSNPRAERAIDIALSRALVGRDLARRAIGASVPSREEEIELASLVHDAARGVEQEATRKEAVVSLSLPPEAQGARLRDAGAALQILTNLLLNAIEMGSRSVVIEAALVADEAQIDVIDDGPGVEASRHESIFDGAPSSRPGGAGLGLRHARALAREKGGELSIEPAARGAHFRLAWPISPPRSGFLRPLGSLPLAGIQVAILDDDEVVLELLTTALEARGASVHAVRTTAELDSILSRERFDAALVDLSPIAEGGLLPLLRRIKQSSPETAAILISGSATGMPSQADNLAVAWVRKPFELSEVLSAVEEATRNRN